MSDDIKIKAWTYHPLYFTVLYQKTVVSCIDFRPIGIPHYFHNYDNFNSLSRDAQYAVRCAADKFMTAHNVFIRLTT